MTLALCRRHGPINITRAWSQYDMATMTTRKWLQGLPYSGLSEEIAINKNDCVGSLKIKDNLKEFVNTSLGEKGVLSAF